ncbi:hypothetical protein HPP92_025010 [Vanilla planifolia]|uniref:Glycosyltransferase n=1 Tax=Vanilla planifolia TaxID=51239 RepID=A0A835PEK9_VANPL|nr:hypothetical protein HPP92_025010 [Vanilla planifolia]
MEKRRPHFMVVSYGAQSHINPSLVLARRLALATGALVTFSTNVFSHRRLPLAVREDSNLVSHSPYTDGFDDGYDYDAKPIGDYNRYLKLVATKSLSSIVEGLSAIGRPVTCLIYTCFSTWVTDVAVDHGITSVPFWVQPAISFAAYWHFFHGFGDLIVAKSGDRYSPVEFPRMPPLQIRELPTLLTITSPEDPIAPFLAAIREMCAIMDASKNKPKLLVNSWREMEVDAIASIAGVVDVYDIGPMKTEGRASIFSPDTKDYMRWLDDQDDASVVYISFGSYSLFSKEQVEEIQKALEVSGKPFLWVLRRDNMLRLPEIDVSSAGNGMVVEWCEQARVLEHRAVGCFVTHCGWNSTSESLARGVGMVAMPQSLDQGGNAWLVEKVWEVGVRAEVGEGGMVMAEELGRCLREVMESKEVRKKVEWWKERVSGVMENGGFLDSRLQEFVEDVDS